MKKLLLLIAVPFVFISLPAQITREQADAIVLQYIENEVTPPYLLLVNVNLPSEEDITITTFQEEVMKIKYPCWAYYLNENPDINEPSQHRYLFVKENDGNLLEVITSNDHAPEDLSQWTTLQIPPPLNPLAIIEGIDCSEVTLSWTAPERSNFTYRVQVKDGRILVDNYPDTKYTYSDRFETDVTYTWEIITVVSENIVSNPTEVSITNTCLPVGMENIDLSNKIELYPNPTTGELRMENGELKITNVEIYDILGKKQEIILNSQLSIINCSHLPAGNYFIQFHTEQGIITKKFVKN